MIGIKGLTGTFLPISCPVILSKLLFHMILFFTKLFFALFLLFLLQHVKLDVTPFSDFRHNISLTPSRTDLGKMERSMLQGGHGKAAQSSQNN